MTEPRVVRNIRRPAPELLAELAGYGVATVHEAYGRRGLLAPEIRPVLSGRRVCGPAVTSLNTAGDNLMVHAAVELCRPGDVLVIATTEPSAHGMVGDLLCTQAAARGIVALVIDSGVRDVAGLREMEFPVWSRVITAQGTTKEHGGSVNLPVVCAGQTIRPGDAIVADDDGVVVVAADDMATVVAAAAAREAREAVLRGRYAAGESSLDVSSLRSVLDRLGVRYIDGG
jgi:4-hydroxy-4-methyl-2-oxoglutarate aldolase